MQMAISRGQLIAKVARIYKIVPSIEGQNCILLPTQRHLKTNLIQFLQPKKVYVYLLIVYVTCFLCSTLWHGMQLHAITKRTYLSILFPYYCSRENVFINEPKDFLGRSRGFAIRTQLPKC